MKRFRIFDLLFIIFLILASLSPLIFVNSDNRHKRLKIIIENSDFYFPLTETKIINLRKYGKNMLVQIGNNQAHILESDCRNKICIRAGWIKNCGESAVCLPNKVAIQIDCEKNYIDAYSR